MSGIVVLLLILLTRGIGFACVGSECLQIWSTEPGGGALTIEYDFDREIQTYESFCTPDRTLCLFSAIDPGFIASAEDTPGDSFYPLAPGTAVRIEIDAIAAGLSIRINGQTVRAGGTANLGVMPTIHVHPAWQVEGPGDAFGDYPVTYRLLTDSPSYDDSGVITALVTNEPPQVDPTPTPSPTPAAILCEGDCDQDEQVTVDEILRGVGMALGTTTSDDCPAFDANHDGMISVDEIIAAITTALTGCGSIVPVSFTEIQQSILTPRCATVLCHDSTSKTGELDLSEGNAYAALVGIEPDIFSARAAGLLRVRAGDPDTSFLLIKLNGPPLSQGSRMPLTGALLTAQQTELVRNWILQGALP